MYYQEYNRKTVLLNNGTDDGKAGLSLKNMENQFFFDLPGTRQNNKFQK